MENDLNNSQPEYANSIKPQRDKRFMSVQATGIFLLIIIASYLITSEILGIIIGYFNLREAFSENATVYNLINIVFETMYIGVPCLVAILLYNKNLKFSLRLNPLSVKEILLTVVIGIIAYLANTYITSFNLMLASLFTEIDLPQVPDNVTALDKVLSLLLLAVVAPALEEFIMRGLIMRGFEGKSKWFAITVTALFFGFLHFSYETLLGKIFGGFVMCYIVYITDSIYSGIIAHMINNSIPGIILLLQGNAEQTGETAINEMEKSEVYVTMFVSLMLAVGLIAAVIGLFSVMRNMTKKPTDDGRYIYKGRRRVTLAVEQEIKWYSYLPIVLSFVLMTFFMFLN